MIRWPWQRDYAVPELLAAIVRMHDPSMRVLRRATPQQRQAPVVRMYPAVIRKMDTRGAAYILRGRDEEFTNLASSLPQMPGSLFVIEGPPGSGKTCLLTALRTYAAARNFMAIDLNLDVLTDRAKFCEDVLAACHGRTGAHGVEQVQLVDVTSTRRRLWKLKFWERERTRQTREEYANRTTTPPNLVDVLEQVVTVTAERGRRGVLITIDEASEAERDGADREGTPYSEFSKIVQVGNNQALVHGIPVQTVYAGINRTVNLVRDASVGRLEPDRIIRLCPISTAAVHEIIADHLQVWDETERKPVQPSTSFRDDLACGAEGHVLFATIAGAVLQKTGLAVREEGREPFNNADETAAREEIGELRKVTYQRLLGTGGTTQYRIGEHIALAMGQRQNRLTPAQVNGIIQAVANSPDRVTVAKWRRELVRLGVMDEMDPSSRYVGRSSTNDDQLHFRLVTPSLATWVSELKNEGRKETLATVDAVLAQYPEQSPGWQWTHSPQIHRVESIDEPNLTPRQRRRANLPPMLLPFATPLVGG